MQVRDSRKTFAADTRGCARPSMYLLLSPFCCATQVASNVPPATRRKSPGSGSEVTPLRQPDGREAERRTLATAGTALPQDQSAFAL